MSPLKYDRTIIKLFEKKLFYFYNKYMDCYYFFKAIYLGNIRTSVYK